MDDKSDKETNYELQPEIGRCYYEPRCETPCGDIDMAKVREVMDKCPHRDDIIPIVHSTVGEEQTFTLAQITEAQVKALNEYLYENRHAFSLNPLIIRRITSELCCEIAEHLTLPDEKKVEDILYDTSKLMLPRKISLDDVTFAPPQDNIQPKGDKDDDCV